MAVDAVQLQIDVETKDAIKNIEKFQKEAVQSTASIEKAFGQLKAVAVAAVGVIASRELINFFVDATRAAINQENAINRLNIALASTGEYTDEASQSFQDLATELQRTTKYEDDAVLGAIALAKNFGITNEETEALTKAAVDLASATGTDLNTAVEQLGKTYSGTAGSLGKMVPELKTLTKEQLLNGEAIEVIARRYKGFAEGEVQTFGGALQKLENIIGDVKEEFGFLITQNPAIIKSINESGKCCDSLGRIVAEKKGTIIDISNVLLGTFVDAVVISIKSVKGLVAIFDVLQTTLSLALSSVARASGAASTILGSSVFLFSKTGQDLRDFGKDAVKFSDDIAENAANTSVGLEKIDHFISEVTVSAEKSAKSIKQSFTNASDGAEKTKKNVDELAQSQIRQGIEAERNARLMEAAQERLDKFYDDQKKQADIMKAELEEQNNLWKKFAERNASIAASPFEFAVDVVISPDSKDQIQQDLQTAAEGISFGAGILNSVLGGKAGAEKLISKLGGKLADAFIPGIGPVVTEALSLLSKGPEATKQFITEFIKAVPDIVTAIAESIPVVVETLVDVLITQGGLVRIAEALLKAAITLIPNVGIALARSFANAISLALNNLNITDAVFNEEKLRNIFNNLGNGFVANIQSGISNLGANIANTFKNIFPTPQWIETLRGLIEDLKNANPFSGGDKGGVAGFIQNPVGTVRGALGKAGIKLADGGVVPPGFPNDTYPALLTSGETVIPPAHPLPTSDGSGPSTQQPVQVNLVIGQQQLASIILDLNRQGFRTA